MMIDHTAERWIGGVYLLLLLSARSRSVSRALAVLAKRHDALSLAHLLSSQQGDILSAEGNRNPDTLSPCSQSHPEE